MDHEGNGAGDGAWWVRVVLIPLVLAGLVGVQARAVRLSTSETYDEPLYLKVALQVVRFGDFRAMAGPMSPPLPLLLGYWLPALRAESDPKSVAWRRESPALIQQARLLASSTFGIPLVLVVYGWLVRRRGLVAGALGGLIAATSPTILAAASLATTDACFALFGVVALAAVVRYQSRPTTNSFLAMGGALGLALASKQSAVVLFGVAAVAVGGDRPRVAAEPGSSRIGRGLRVGWWLASRVTGVVALAFLVDWAVCGFGVARFGAPGTSCVAPDLLVRALGLVGDDQMIAEILGHTGAPLPIDTLVGQMQHARQGHGAYLMGATSFRGWWYFFPVALALKSTPAELTMMALALVLSCRPRTWRDPARRSWVLASGLMLAAGMASSVNIGQRYMILVYPLVVLLALDWGAERAGRSRHRARWLALGLVLALGQAVSAATIAPHDLSYFNAFCGGPMAGHRYLLDSNLDWGQDLPALRRELEARGSRLAALNYFGSARPEVYGIRATDWLGPAPTVAGADTLAISATALHGVYGEVTDLSALFGDLPSTRAGYSIFVYDLKDPAVRLAWLAARHAAGVAGP